MKTLQAFIELKAAILGLQGLAYTMAIPQLEKDGRASMRKLGMTNEEIESTDFPEEMVSEGVGLIENDPDEFKRRMERASKIFVSRN